MWFWCALFQVDVRVTWDAGDVDQFVKEAVHWHENDPSVACDTIVAGGGDGTFNEVVSAMIKHDAPKDMAVALLPLGTANDMACVTGVSVVSDMAWQLSLVSFVQSDFNLHLLDIMLCYATSKGTMNGTLKPNHKLILTCMRSYGTWAHASLL